MRDMAILGEISRNIVAVGFKREAFCAFSSIILDRGWSTVW